MIRSLGRQTIPDLTGEPVSEVAPGRILVTGWPSPASVPPRKVG